VRTDSVPKKDRAGETMTGRLWAARIGIFLGALGMLVWIIIFVFDIYYSYEAFAPAVNNTAMAFALAVMTTPLEWVGAYLMSCKEQRKEIGQAKFWGGMAIVAAAYVVDIASNWLGMICDMTGFNGTGKELSFNFAALSGLQTWIVLIVGTGSAFVEHIIDMTVRMVAGHIRQMKDSHKWLVDNGYLEDESGPTHGPSRGSPHRTGPMSSPMAARGGDGGPRREPPSGGRPPTRRAM